MSKHLNRNQQSSPATGTKSCGHPRHVGSCPACQRAQLERWSLQLANARPIHRAAA
jgi:hypothetical protein